MTLCSFYVTVAGRMVKTPPTPPPVTSVFAYLCQYAHYKSFHPYVVRGQNAFWASTEEHIIQCKYFKKYSKSRKNKKAFWDKAKMFLTIGHRPSRQSEWNLETLSSWERSLYPVYLTFKAKSATFIVGTFQC